MTHGSCDMFNLESSYFHVALTTVRHLLNVALTTHVHHLYAVRRGLDDDARRYVRDLCLLMTDNNSDNATLCRFADIDTVESLRLNASGAAPAAPCRLPPATLDPSSRCK